MGLQLTGYFNYGYGAMVMLSLEKCIELTGDIETKLDEADNAAALDIRYTHDEVFSRLKGVF